MSDHTIELVFACVLVLLQIIANRTNRKALGNDLRQSHADVIRTVKASLRPPDFPFEVNDPALELQGGDVDVGKLDGPPLELRHHGVAVGRQLQYRWRCPYCQDTGPWLASADAALALLEHEACPSCTSPVELDHSGA